MKVKDNCIHKLTLTREVHQFLPSQIQSYLLPTHHSHYGADALIATLRVLREKTANFVF